MDKRPIDKSKKSNIKCEHCLYADNDKKTYKRWCAVHRIEKTIGIDVRILSGQKVRNE